MAAKHYTTKLRRFFREARLLRDQQKKAIRQLGGCTEMLVFSPVLRENGCTQSCATCDKKIALLNQIERLKHGKDTGRTADESGKAKKDEPEKKEES